jgi:hypothetical protein
VERLIVASSSLLTRDRDALDRLGTGTVNPAEQKVWTDRAIDDHNRGRANAIAAADRDVNRRDARADYLARVDEIRFTTDWDEPWRAGILPRA